MTRVSRVGWTEDSVDVSSREAGVQVGDSGQSSEFGTGVKTVTSEVV